MFPNLYCDLAMMLEKDRPVVVTGRVSIKEDKPSVLADNIFFLDEPIGVVWIRFQNKSDFEKRKTALESIALHHRGSSMKILAGFSRQRRERNASYLEYWFLI